MLNIGGQLYIGMHNITFNLVMLVSELEIHEGYQVQLPTLQDLLSIIQADLDHVQTKRVELDVEYRKVEANWKPLELIAALDVRELRIVIDWAKHFEKERVDLDAKLHSQPYDFRKSMETIERLQLNVQELFCHAPIT